MPDPADFYTIWTGTLNLGDTPGVFTEATFTGLILQLPVTITFLAEDAKEPIRFLLETTEVEIFGGKKHPVLWDWAPGDDLPTPAGYIDDTQLTPGQRELHYLELTAEAVKPGRHTLTILVNPEIAAGLKDDFILRRIAADNQIGAKIGW